MTVTAVVLGATGFTGADTLRLLLGHPEVRLVAAGRGISGEERNLPHLPGVELVSHAAAREQQADVCFSCLPAPAAGAGATAASLVIDLSDAHRADPAWTYGLSEWSRPELKGADRIANPGCYPTAAALCLLPFANAGVISAPVVIDALSGYTGAGRGARDGLLFAVGDEDASAYGDIPHRHVAEIERTLKVLGGLDVQVSFTPHLVPMARGLLVTARARLTEDMTTEAALAILKDAYDSETFVAASDAWPHTKATRGSNAAQVSARVDARTGWLIASAAIDNLGKGAAGQAVQNMNIALELEESTGLAARGVWP